MLDCGAGVGGPPGFAAQETGARPVLSEPQAGACRAARRLFGLPTVQAGSELPFAAGSFDVVWSLGVLCTVDDQPLLLRELHRVLAPGARLGCWSSLPSISRCPPNRPETTSPLSSGLRDLLSVAGFRVLNSASEGDFTALPTHWQERADAVDAELERRHRDDPAWQVAGQQSAIMGRLLSDQELVGTLIVARRV